MIRLKDKQYLNEMITKSREIRKAYLNLSPEIREQTDSFSGIKLTMKFLDSDIDEIETNFEEDLS